MSANKGGVFAAVLAACVLWTGAAQAGITGFIGDLVNPESTYAGFLGTWSYADNTPSDIDHILVSTAGSDQVRIQVFGRCESRVCNWGALLGHVRFDSPEAGAVRSIAADYNLGFALRHVTLRRVPGNALRFDIVTEFTDGSGRHDYESSGRLITAGSKAAAPAAVSPSAAALAAAGTAPAVSSAVPAVPFTSVGNETPESEPVAAYSGAAPGDCFSFDTDHLYLAPDTGHWKVRDFLHPVLDFGPYRAAANKAMAVIAHYHFDEICRVGRSNMNLSLLRSVGEVPRAAMPKENCVAVNPDKVTAVQRDDDWKVVDGEREIFIYGSDQEAATQAAGIIKSLALNRQCYFDKENTPLSYWLAR